MAKTKRKSEQLSRAQRWQRIALATSAILLITCGATVGQLPISAGSKQLFGDTLLKVGVVLGLAWLAAPQLTKLGWGRIQGTMLVAIIIVLILFTQRPRLGAVAAAILVAGSALVSIQGWLRKMTKP